jgi:integrase
VFRKTCATILDEAGLTARVVADQLGHSKVSMTQDDYMGHGSLDRRIGTALEAALGVSGL